MLPTAVSAPTTIAPQASTAPATVVPTGQQSGLLRSVQHAAPSIETQKTEATNRRRKKSDEDREEGSELAAEGFANFFRRARLRFLEGEDRPVVAVRRHDGRGEEIDIETFAERARASGRPRPGMVLDAYY